MSRTAFLTVCLVLAVPVVAGSVVTPASAAARVGRQAIRTGGDSASLGDYVPTVRVERAMAAKVALRNQLMAERSRASSASPDICTSTDPCLPTSGAGSLPHPLYAEGQGDNNAWWTCGPAATRNLVAGISGIVQSEHQFAVWEDDTVPGAATPIGNIVSTLNSHFSAYGRWGTDSPANANQLQSDIEVDVNASDQQSAILNVHTVDLKFWDGVDDGHYDLGYRYDLPDNTIGVAEEWDHEDAGGSSPFGFHPNVPQSQVVNAVIDSASQEIVW